MTAIKNIVTQDESTTTAMHRIGATVNVTWENSQDLMQAAVVGAMLALPPEQYDAKTADMLKLAFEEICKVTGTGETWTFFETVGDLIPEVTP